MAGRRALRRRAAGAHHARVLLPQGYGVALQVGDVLHLRLCGSVLAGCRDRYQRPQQIKRARGGARKRKGRQAEVAYKAFHLVSADLAHKTLENKHTVVRTLFQA